MTPDPTRSNPENLTSSGAMAAPVVDAAGRGLRAPWAAGAAGLLFAGLFTAALVLLRTSPLIGVGDRELGLRLANGEDIGIVIGGLYCAPLAGIMFLWFIAVVRDQIGDREDRFFATVFFGSGVIFVAMLFAGCAAASSVAIGYRFGFGDALPSSGDLTLMRGFGYALLFAFATRAAGVFMISTATIGLRTGVFPRWFALTGYLLGVVLLAVVSFYDWAILVLPVWVAIVSLFILRRERARLRSALDPAT